MERVFASPSRYVQGAHVLETGIEHIKELGSNALLLAGNHTWSAVGEIFAKNLEAAGMSYTRVAFQGEASRSEIARAVEIARENQSDVVLGLGGGKAIDSAKAIADEADLPVVILPTLASTDAPTSALSVIYTDDGAFESYLFYKKNPELVMVDTDVIAKSPVRYLASGIADAMATLIEVKAVSEKHGDTMAGGKQTLAAVAIAEKAEETLFNYGLQAIEANRQGVVTAALESVVEANTLLSGLGFESGGLAAAHAIHNGFTALTGDIHHLTHGEKVAYGTLTQLVLQNETAETLNKYIDFYQKLGLPTTLAEMHLENASREDLLKIGVQATAEGETIHQMPFEVTAEDVANALVAVDAYVKSR
ncbi:glycerol dehydrogenase [Weissella cibaria]|uniref:glycerol dehydrogenase n=1 Tax=Weissella TaxID=46255 RepID=UPI00021926F9|nr:MULTISPECIES: glycerol dehydrogenase [Weissella]APS27378.1 Glycerol dehydrogenase [Weissella cibaria]APU62776.1 Glycerol dehydrogenase [Weissella cibaria]APU64927.1 Glycerol dehydrogenase [Weissella cibaria]ASS51698.1 Glycerol dehydrogenase [Weissella cibaria]KXU02510.1 Glycerol dehydrogenase [Weissella sp. DD23]